MEGKPHIPPLPAVWLLLWRVNLLNAISASHFLMNYHFLLLFTERGACLGVLCSFGENWIPQAMSQWQPLTRLPLLKAATSNGTPTHTHTRIFLVLYVNENPKSSDTHMHVPWRSRQGNDREQGLTWQPNPVQVQLVTTPSQQLA